MARDLNISDGKLLSMAWLPNEGTDQWNTLVLLSGAINTRLLSHIFLYAASIS